MRWRQSMPASPRSPARSGSLPARTPRPTCSCGPTTPGVRTASTRCSVGCGSIQRRSASRPTLGRGPTHCAHGSRGPAALVSATGRASTWTRSRLQSSPGRRCNPRRRPRPNSSAWWPSSRSAITRGRRMRVRRGDRQRHARRPGARDQRPGNRRNQGLAHPDLPSPATSAYGSGSRPCSRPSSVNTQIRPLVDG